MATMITDECINCGACRPSARTPRSPGRRRVRLAGRQARRAEQRIFYIVPEKCTECVGFYDHEGVCRGLSGRCCIPNPNIPESEAVLLARAAEIHPDKTFGPDSPSRFKGGDGAAAGGPPGKPPVPRSRCGTRSGSRGCRTGCCEAGACGRRQGRQRSRRGGALLQQPTARTVPYRGEPLSFDEARELVGTTHPSGGVPLIPISVSLLQPLLGALPAKTKDRLEAAFNDRRVFSSAGATGMNLAVHMVVIPLLFSAFAVVALNESSTARPSAMVLLRRSCRDRGGGVPDARVRDPGVRSPRRSTAARSTDRS